MKSLLPVIAFAVLSFGMSPPTLAESPEKLTKAKKTTTLDVNFGADKALTLRGKHLNLAIEGLVQSQFAFFTGSDNLIQDGDPAEAIGVRLRRARLGLSGQMIKIMDFNLTMEADQHGLNLLDAWIGYRRSTAIGFVLGAHKVPFSRFQMMSSARGALIERPLATTALAPGHQVGLTLGGEIAKGKFKYAVGVYNGLERYTNLFEGYVQGTSLLGNRFNGLAFAARLATEPLGALGSHMADLDKGKFRFGIGGSFLFSQGETTRSMGWEVDLHLKVAGFHLAAEYVSDHGEPVDQPTRTLTIPAEIDRTALAVEAGYMILASKLGVTVRAELIDDNAAVENNGDAFVFTGGLQYYWMQHHVRANLDFIHREEMKGLARDNDTLLLQLQVGL